MKNCEHDERAVCWLCSDQVSWWREARIRAGLGEEPPNERRYVPTEITEPVGVVKTCTRARAVTPPRPIRSTPELAQSVIDEYWENHPQLSRHEAAREVRRLVRTS